MREIKFRAWNSHSKKMEYMKPYENLFTISFISYMQYTGFKDKNGKEIYECDILGGDYYVNGIAGKVEFYEDLGAWLLVYAGGGDEFLCKATKVAEVIGNMYEDPELLKA